MRFLYRPPIPQPPLPAIVDPHMARRKSASYAYVANLAAGQRGIHEAEKARYRRRVGNNLDVDKYADSTCVQCREHQQAPPSQYPLQRRRSIYGI